MRRAALLALLSHWRRHPLQLILLCAGLALAAALWTAVQALNSEARRSYARAAELTRPAAVADLSAPAGFIPLAQYAALAKQGWLLSPVIEGRWDSPAGRVQLLGIDPLTHPPLPAMAQALQDGQLTALLSAPGVLIAGPGLAQRFADLPALPPVLASPDVPAGIVLTDIATADRLLQRSGALSRLLVLPGQIRPLETLRAQASGLTFTPAGSRTGGPEALTASFHLNLSAFGFLSFAVGLFIVHGTAGLAAEQRRGVFRSLRAMGVPQQTLAGLMLAELMLLALAAGGAGIAAGYGIARLLMPGVSATLAGLYSAPAAEAVQLRPGWVLSGLAMTAAGTFLAGSQALWRVWRLPVLAAPGALAWARGAAAGRIRLAGVGVLLALSGSLALFSSGLLAGFAFLGGLLLGAAFCLPLALTMAAGFCARLARRPLPQWFWADLRAQLPGLSLALMALLLALSASIGVTAMAGSFRLTFTGWMEQRLAADLYLTAASSEEGRAIRDWVREQGAAPLPIRSAVSPYRGASLEIHGVQDHISYRQHWPMLAALPGPWDQVAAGTGVLVSEQFARRQGLALGSRLEPLPGAEFTVAGIYSDYGNPSGQIITSLGWLTRSFPGLPETRYAIYAAPGSAAALAEELQAEFNLSAGRLIDQARLRQQALAVFDRTFLITRSLSLLTLGVAGFAILTTLLGLWERRLPQVAPVWALGVTRRRLAALDLLRSLALTAMTCILALPLGLALAWVLLKVINAEAFGWSLPMHHFPASWLQLFALAHAAAALAAAIPALRLLRLPPARLLGVFAHER